MINWKDTVVEQLANTPEDWHPLGELFHHVADHIPMHTAIRVAATKRRHQLRKNGLDETVTSADFDLPKAQWLLFTRFVLPLVERKDNIHRATQTEQVRLKPHNNCKTCEAPTYLTKLGSGERKVYKCLNCAKPKLVSITPVIELSPVKRKHIKKHTSPPLRLVPATVQQLPKPIRPPKPKPEPIITIVASMHTLTSLNQVWNVYKDAVKQRIPSFQSNPKLRKILYRAIEAGALDQHTRMLHFKTNELHQFQITDQCEQIWFGRAISWMSNTFTPSQRRRFANVLVAEAFGFGSLYILALTRNNLLEVIYDEMENIRTKLEPLPKPVKPLKIIKQRWGSPIKAARNMVSRWLIK